MTTFLQYVIDAISLARIDALIALGIALVFGIMRLVNFAHGELIMIGAYALSSSPASRSGSRCRVIAVVVVVVALLMERIAFRPVRERDPMTLL